MSIYDGVVTIDEDDVQVILGVDEDGIRLSAGGLEIGEWTPEDCSIDAAGDGVFTITAENETLTFVPNNPRTFAAAVNGGSIPDPPVTTTLEDSTGETPTTVTSDSNEVPDPKPATMIVFYALAAITGVLGLWALISIIF